MVRVHRVNVALPFSGPARVILRFVVPSAALLDALARMLADERHLGAARAREIDETYHDTCDGALESRGITCRVRSIDGGARTARIEARSPIAHPDAIPFRWAETSLRDEHALAARQPHDEATRWLATLVEPERLVPRVRLLTRRTERRRRTLFSRVALVVALDDVRVLDDAGLEVARFFEASIEAERSAIADAERIAASWQARFGLARATLDRRERARQAASPPLVAPRQVTLEQSVSADDAIDLATGSTHVGDAPFLDPDLSLLAFTERVMALASDPRMPLLERVRLLGISGGNLDEFYMVRVSELRRAETRERWQAAAGMGEVAEERQGDGRRAAERLEAIRARAADIHAAQSMLLRRALRELAASGVVLRDCAELTETQRDGLRAIFLDRIHSRLLTSAVTLAPGHPFPRAPHLTLSLAVVGRDRRTDTWRVSQLDLPRDVERFAPVRDSDDFVAIEDVVRAHIGLLYPELEVEGVFPFRLTRGGELPLEDELGEQTQARPAVDVLDLIADATRRRPFNAVVRMEVEREMPWNVRRIVLEALRHEPGVSDATETPPDVYESDGPIGVASLAELAALPRANLRFPAFRGRDVLDPDRSVAEQVAERDRLLHHPYDRFESSVLRLLWEASTDPDVEAIAITLYRTGEPSVVVDALLHAAREGKRVDACVELQARFDEERNVGWTRRLEEAGVHVTHGVNGLKTHAKTMLIERREGARPRRIVHVASGNYNAGTANAYTDLSVLSARDAMTRDARAFFDALVRGAAPLPESLAELTAAPLGLRRRFLALIANEAAHARAGRPARIRLKLNGISDAEMIEALYDASRAGVEIALAVRGLCTLRPGVPGMSERIRVVSAVGRFLEHARIYEFANGSRAPADATTLIGSADWRARNLRRRVELAAPVHERDARERLAELLDLELDDPAAWELGADGVYREQRAARARPATQELLRVKAEA